MQHTSVLYATHAYTVRNTSLHTPLYYTKHTSALYATHVCTLHNTIMHYTQHTSAYSCALHLMRAFSIRNTIMHYTTHTSALYDGYLCTIRRILLHYTMHTSALYDAYLCTIIAWSHHSHIFKLCLCIFVHVYSTTETRPCTMRAIMATWRRYGCYSRHATWQTLCSS